MQVMPAYGIGLDEMCGLTVQRHTIDVAFARWISQQLTHDDTIKIFCIYAGRFESEDAERVLASAIARSRIVEIRLFETELTDQLCTSPVLDCILEAMSLNTTIRTISIRVDRCSLISRWDRFLRDNSNVTDVELSFYATNTWYQHLCDLMMTNKTITDLDITFVSILPDQQLTRLCESILVSKTLEKLRIGGCEGISHDNGIAATHLSCCPSLVHLSWPFPYHGFEPSGGVYDIIKHTTTMSFCGLACAQIHARDLDETIRGNISLRYLDLSHISDHVQVENVIRQMPSIVKFRVREPFAGHKELAKQRQAMFCSGMICLRE